VFVCILPEKAVPEMTYTVSGRTLNGHSLTHCNNIDISHRSWANSQDHKSKL